MRFLHLSFARSAILLLFVASVFSCTSVEDEKPRNIILLIGDGVGFAHVTAAHYELDGLQMNRTPYSGAIYTHSEDALVTGSASSATAMATGFKTNNRMLGQLPDGTPLQSIAHYASELGKSTALKATCRITHATPAAFAVAHDDRGEEFEIAEKMADSGIDMLLGAGWQYFLPENQGGERPDDRNLIDEMGDMGYIYIDDEEDLDQMQGQDRVIAFLESDNLKRYPERGDQSNRLTMSALQELSRNPEGFFMMIEGSMIDWAGHGNDPEYMIQEFEDFDNVVGDVLDFAENDGNTLVIITSDHETGGLTLTGYFDELEYHWSTDGHSAAMVPVYSYGPSAEKFSGTYDNTELARRMFSLWGKEITPSLH